MIWNAGFFGLSRGGVEVRRVALPVNTRMDIRSLLVYFFMMKFFFSVVVFGLLFQAQGGVVINEFMAGSMPGGTAHPETYSTWRNLFWDSTLNAPSAIIRSFTNGFCSTGGNKAVREQGDRPWPGGGLGHSWLMINGLYGTKGLSGLIDTMHLLDNPHRINLHKSQPCQSFQPG